MGMQQLKKALMDAGLVSKEMRREMERAKVKKRHLAKGKKMRADHIRIICELCEKSAPDVERYRHKNRMIEGKEWLCIKCADEHRINDSCRLTEQSTHARTGVFRRQYGRTKKLS
jgi:hypothetical protein